VGIVPPGPCWSCGGAAPEEVGQVAGPFEGGAWTDVKPKSFYHSQEGVAARAGRARLRLVCKSRESAVMVRREKGAEGTLSVGREKSVVSWACRREARDKLANGAAGVAQRGAAGCRSP